MTDTLQRLFDALPTYLDRLPWEEPGFVLEGPGGTTVRVERHRLTTAAWGAAADLDIDLGGLSLAALVGAVNAGEGYTASLVGDGPALTLLDVSGALPLRLMRSTSLLWALMRPLEWALLDARESQMAGFRQMAVPGAEERWLDHWGDLYGSLRRRASETDQVYRARIIAEVTRWRLNGLAIEQLVEDDLGVACRLTNLHDHAWVVGVTPFGYLAGRKYSRTTFEVAVDGFVGGLVDLLNRNRAAGTLVFYRSRDIVPVGEHPQPVAGLLHRRVVVPINGVAEDARTFLETYLVRISEPQAGASMVLGTGLLGTASLGSTGPGSYVALTSGAGVTPTEINVLEVGSDGTPADPGQTALLVPVLRVALPGSGTDTVDARNVVIGSYRYFRVTLPAHAGALREAALIDAASPPGVLGTGEYFCRATFGPYTLDGIELMRVEFRVPV